MAQEGKKKQVYREKSLQRVSSPEQLDGYIRVVNTSTWIILGAVIVLLIGALIWCGMVKLETETVTVAAVVKNEEVNIYVDANHVDSVQEGLTIHIDNEEYTLPELNFRAVKLFEDTDSDVISIIGTTDEEYAYVTRVYASIPNGIYEAKVTTDEISPFALIFN